MTKGEKIRKWIADTGLGLIIITFIFATATNFAGNIKIKKQLDLLQATDLHLNAHLRQLRHVINNINTEHEHEHEHSNPLEAKYDKALKEINRLLKIVRDNGEYCVRKGDITCAQ